MMKPSLGRVVHYLENGRVFAGLIIDIFADGRVSIVIWDKFGNQSGRVCVSQSNEVATHDRHWFWPPMLKPTVGEVEKIKEVARSMVKA